MTPKIKISPDRLPEPVLQKTEEYDRSAEKPEIRAELKEYYWKQKYKKPSEKRRR